MLREFLLFISGLPDVFARQRDRRVASVPAAQDWWPVVLGIERVGKTPALTFQARTARLVWHVTAGLRHRGTMEFSGLWLSPAGQWFYVDANLRRPRWGGWTLHSAGAIPITPRRAYNALLPYPRLLADEFPAGRPFEEPADEALGHP